MSDEQLHSIYGRVFDSFKRRLDESDEKVLFPRFIERFNTLPKDNARLLATPIEETMETGTYWQQSMLESKLWNLCEDLIRSKVSRNKAL